MSSELARLLKQRGHEVTKEGSDKQLLLPAFDHPEMTSAFKNLLYGFMRRDSFRRGLRDWAYGNRRSNENPVVTSFIALCHSLACPWTDDMPSRQSRYSATFEWYVSELLCREFAARASGFGLRLKDAEPEDEFDCVAVVDKGLVFVECKTGKGDLYDEVRKFLRRDKELGAEYSLFVYDRDYTFKRGEADLPDLTKEKAATLGIDEISLVTAGKHSFFKIAGADRYLLASPALNGFEDRLRYMIRYSNAHMDSVIFGVHFAPPPGFTVAPQAFA